MKYSFPNKIIATLFLALVSFSCASDLDFDQVNDVKLEPAYVTNLAYFDVPANDFVTGGTEQTLTFDEQTVDLFNDDFFRDNLVKTEFFFEFNNTINRAYAVDIILFNANDAPLYTMHFDVPANTGVENLVTKTEVFEGAKLDLLKNTVKMAFVLRLLPGPVLSESSLGSIKLRSGLTAYLVVE
jgi:hypothetical protein